MQNNESADKQGLLNTLVEEADSLKRRIKNIEDQRKKLRLKLETQKEQAVKEQEAIKQILIIAQQESIQVQLEKNEATRERETMDKTLINHDLKLFENLEDKERFTKQKEEAIWQNMKNLGERMGKLAERILDIDDKMGRLEEKASEKRTLLESALGAKQFEIELKQNENAKNYKRT